MNYKSHSKNLIDGALKMGVPVYALNTGTDGEDDVLIGTRLEIIEDLCIHYELIELPAHWTLEEVV